MSTLGKVISSLIVLALLIIGIGSQLTTTKDVAFTNIPEIEVDINEGKCYNYYMARELAKKYR